MGHPRHLRRRPGAGVAVAVALLLVPATGRTQDTVAAGARPVTLTEAIRLAQENAPQTISARGNERTNQAAVRAAYGAFIPAVTANVGAVRQFTGAGTVTRVNQSGERVTIQGNSWTYSNGLSLSAQLFNANRVPNLRAAKADVQAAQQNEIAQGAAVALNVEQQFFSALSALESESAARTQLQQATQQLDASRRRVIAGAATASDSLRALAQVATAQLAVLQAQTTLLNANATLTRLVGSTVPVAARLDDPTITAFDSVRVDSAAIIAEAASGPPVRTARANVSAAQARRQAARAAYFPSLNASYSRGGSGLDSRFGFGSDPFAYSGQLSLSLSYPLFNQFSREAQVAQATVNATNAAATLRDAQLQATQLAVQDLNALRLGQEQVAVETAAVVAAREDLRVQQQRYQVGLATIVDVLSAQTTLNQAQANVIAARNTVRLAAAQIEQLIGRSLITAPPAGVTR